MVSFGVSMTIDECVIRINNQKKLIEQMKLDKSAFDNSTLGRRGLMTHQDWCYALNLEEKVLCSLRDKLCELRGE